jgi:putative MFS transporter
MVFGALVMIGLTYGPGRLANVAGPFIVARVYAELGYEAVFGFVAGCYVLRGLGYAVYGLRATERSLEDVNGRLALEGRLAS